jgi:molecular chaperone DnaJ
VRLEQDPYDVLGVTRQASRDEIKQAFRRLARELHPDVAERPREGAFEEVVAAYHVLAHPRRRLLYDRLGRGVRRRPPARPAPGVPPVELSLEWYEAVRGASKPVEFEEPVVCRACSGAGFERGVTPGTCVACCGTGRVSTFSESRTLRYLEFATCAACEGRGREPAPACRACSGRGSRVELRRLRVRTPPGVRDGDQLRVEGIGRRFVLEVAQRPRDSRLVLVAAAAALLCALGLLASIVLR